jgi:hypothetical protein
MQGFNLAGGTALALYIGHRRSIDIDLFCISSFDEQMLLEQLTLDLNFSLHFAESNTLKGSVGGIKTYILAHRYPLIDEIVHYDDMILLSIPDIAAMKLNAISLSGQRIKDFVDIYFLLEQYTLGELLDFYRRKYTLQNDAIVLKSLVWFEDAEPADWPVILKEPGLSWNKVKMRLIQSVKGL